MNNFGHQTLTIGGQNVFNTGVDWEYLTVINESPYLLGLNFSGIGSIDFPAWFQGDIPVNKGYTGTIVITPVNYLGITQIVSQLVSLNAWIKGELKNPQWVALSQNFGNVVTTTATQVINDGFPSGTTVVEATQQGNTLGSNVKLLNTGEFVLQEYTGSVLNTLLHTIPNASAGTTDVALGKAGNNTEIIGYFVADHTAQFNSDVTVSGNFSMGNVLQSGAFPVQINNSHSPALDLENATGTIGIQLGAGNIQAISPNNIVLNVANSANNIQQQIAGTTIFEILSNYTQINTPLFSTASGSVSGTANLFCPIWGTGLKVGYLQMVNNFQTASNVTLLFPSSLTSVFVYSSSIGPNTTFQFFNGGTQSSMRHLLTVGAAGAAGTDESVTNFKQLNLGQALTADRVIINTTGAGNINSFLWFIGQ